MGSIDFSGLFWGGLILGALIVAVVGGLAFMLGYWLA